jgi:tetratricopeptide (TPR) repeat protein
MRAPRFIGFRSARTFTMKRFRFLSISLAAFAIVAIAFWPAYVQHRTEVARISVLPTIAPVTPDYVQRDRLVSLWEKSMAQHLRGDFLSPRELAEQYLQRYRERGDVGDVLRAEAAAVRSLRALPRGNLAAEVELASVLLTLHRFHAALAVTHDIERWDSGDDSMDVREASLDLEVGDYTRARAKLHAVRARDRDDGWRVVESRYLELTGHLAQARALLGIATAYQNAVFDAPAQQRAWYFFREGEMAFEAGDNDGAIADETQALAVFPSYADALRVRARIACSLHRWNACLEDATASASEVPYPETLGYEADAQRALGQIDAAQKTADLIVAVEKVGNAQHISDRFLAMYYSDHRIRTADAYAIARGELAVRDDIFTEDTLAWAAAVDGRWSEARVACRKALRFGTENALLQYHAGAIALHFGDRAEATRRFRAALALNPAFHPTYADDARAQLAKHGST